MLVASCVPAPLLFKILSKDQGLGNVFNILCASRFVQLSSRSTNTGRFWTISSSQEHADLVVGIDVCGDPHQPTVVPYLMPALQACHGNESGESTLDEIETCTNAWKDKGSTWFFDMLAIIHPSLGCWKRIRRRGAERKVPKASDHLPHSGDCGWWSFDALGFHRVPRCPSLSTVFRSSPSSG